MQDSVSCRSFLCSLVFDCGESTGGLHFYGWYEVGMFNRRTVSDTCQTRLLSRKIQNVSLFEPCPSHRERQQCAIPRVSTGFRLLVLQRTRSQNHSARQDRNTCRSSPEIGYIVGEPFSGNRSDLSSHLFPDDVSPTCAVRNRTDLFQLIQKDFCTF